MPFPKVTRPAPTQVGTVVITLKDIPAKDGELAARSFSYQLSLVDAQGNRLDTAQGDLEPHLSAAQKTALGNFLDAMRTKAVEALP
jgi:hypothetical protein